MAHKHFKKRFDPMSGGWKLTYGTGQRKLDCLLFISLVTEQWYLRGAVNAGPVGFNQAVQMFLDHARSVYPGDHTRARPQPHLRQVGRPGTVKEVCLSLPPGVFASDAPAVRGKKDIAKARAWNKQQWDDWDNEQYA